MEFPHTGVRCSVQDCKQLDFLPFTCSYCSNIFCKEHFDVTSHSCEKFLSNVASGTEKTVTFTCSLESCLVRTPCEMPCIKCKKHFCLTHRYHGCLEQSEENRLKELERWKKPKEEFLKAKSLIDQEISNKLKKSKNLSMANKVQLMKLKGKSSGPINVPTIDRRYFLVHPPLNGPTKIFENPKGAFVSVNWSIGKVIDSISDSLKIPNLNNVSKSQKLKIFNYSTGNVITNQMDTTLSELLNNNSIVDGQDIIMEYSNDDCINTSLYK